jgi:uncharacterized protein (TIGR02444 family)
LVQRNPPNGDTDTLNYDNDFWRFSLAVYGEADVAEECLALQQAIEADINFLLFCAWIGTRAIILSRKDIEAALKNVSAWQEHVVRPLRSVRQQIKALTHDEFESFRARVKSMEIEAEQIEQAILFAYSKGIQNAHACADCREAVTQNVKKYIEIKSGSKPERGSDFYAPFLIDAAVRLRS